MRTSRSRCRAAAGRSGAERSVPGDIADGAAAADDGGPSGAGGCQLAACAIVACATRAPKRRSELEAVDCGAGVRTLPPDPRWLSASSPPSCIRSSPIASRAARRHIHSDAAPATASSTPPNSEPTELFPAINGPAVPASPTSSAPTANRVAQTTGTATSRRRPTPTRARSLRRVGRDQPDRDRPGGVQERTEQDQHDLQKDQRQQLDRDQRHQRQVDQLPAAQRDPVDGVEHQLVQAGHDRGQGEHHVRDGVRHRGRLRPPVRVGDEQRRDRYDPRDRHRDVAALAEHRARRAVHQRERQQTNADPGEQVAQPVDPGEPVDRVASRAVTVPA